MTTLKEYFGPTAGEMDEFKLAHFFPEYLPGYPKDTVALCVMELGETGLPKQEMEEVDTMFSSLCGELEAMDCDRAGPRLGCDEWDRHLTTISYTDETGGGSEKLRVFRLRGVLVLMHEDYGFALQSGLGTTLIVRRDNLDKLVTKEGETHFKEKGGEA